MDKGGGVNGAAAPTGAAVGADQEQDGRASRLWIYGAEVHGNPALLTATRGVEGPAASHIGPPQYSVALLVMASRRGFRSGTGASASSRRRAPQRGQSIVEHLATVRSLPQNYALHLGQGNVPYEGGVGVIHGTAVTGVGGHRSAHVEQSPRSQVRVYSLPQRLHL